MKEAQSELSVALSLSLASCSPAELASVWLNAAIFKIKYYIYNLSKKTATYNIGLIAFGFIIDIAWLFDYTIGIDAIVDQILHMIQPVADRVIVALSSIEIPSTLALE